MAERKRWYSVGDGELLSCRQISGQAHGRAPTKSICPGYEEDSDVWNM